MIQQTRARTIHAPSQRPLLQITDLRDRDLRSNAEDWFVLNHLGEEVHYPREPAEEEPLGAVLRGSGGAGN